MVIKNKNCTATVAPPARFAASRCRLKQRNHGWLRYCGLRHFIPS
jgi:hypothetical protein